MTLLEAIVLGAVQGLTEFLPISSSGHLVLMQHFLGLSEPRLFFDVMLHVGSLGAVVAVYRRSLAGLLVAAGGALRDGRFWRRPVAAVRASRDLRLIWLLFLGSLPTAAIGGLFAEPLEAAFGSPRLVAAMLVVTGLALQAPRLRRREVPPDADVKAWQAPLVGVVQGLAIIPGISRSGSTISAALLCGVAPGAAAEFSFLLSIPAILGATLLKLREAGQAMLDPWALAAGMLVSFAVGWVALVFLLATLRRGRFSAFSWYCFGLAAVAWIALA